MTLPHDGDPVRTRRDRGVQGGSTPRHITVFGSSAVGPGDEVYDMGVALGRGLATAGMLVTTGGYGGAMEAVSEGAHSVGGTVIGVTAPQVFPARSGANRYVGEEHQASTIIARIGLLVNSADGFVALPGSLGTATELMVVWNDVFVSPAGGRPAKPLVLVTSYWRQMVDLLVQRYGADPNGLFWVDSPEEAVSVLGDSLGP